MGTQKLLHKMFLPTKNLARFGEFFFLFATKPLTRMEPRNIIKSHIQDVFGMNMNYTEIRSVL